MDRYYQMASSFSSSYSHTIGASSEEMAIYNSLPHSYDDQAYPHFLHEDPGDSLILYEEGPKDYSSRSALFQDKKDDVEQMLENIATYDSDIKNEVYLERQNIAREALNTDSCEQRKKALKEKFWIIEDEPIDIPKLWAREIIRKKNSSEFPCNICNEKFRSKVALKRHSYLHTGYKPFQCIYCSKSFTQLSTLNNHKRIHTGEKPFTCAICKNAFRTLSALHKHKNFLHSTVKSHKCELCSKTFKGKYNLKVHQKTHDSTGSLSCEMCNKEFSSKGSLKSHLIANHRTNKQDYPCSRCSKVFQFESLLKQHCKVHDDVRDHVCQVCGASFVWRSSFTSHCRSHLLKLKCDICDKKFASTKKLSIHRFRHSNPKVYSCSKCPKKFKFPYKLKAHEKKHDESLTCATCGENFLTKRKFQAHSKVHNL